jgi:lipopolysaccharide export system protein LptC
MKLLQGPNVFPLTVLLLLVGLTTWLQHATEVESPRRDGKLRHDPDFIAKDFTLRQLDVKGNEKFSLSATRMLHYGDDQSTDVFEPQLTYLATPPPLHFRARRAHISKDGKTIDMEEDVVGWREAGANDAEMSFRSSSLLIYPDDQIARTTAPVTLTQGRSVISGVGMDADNANRTFNLHSQVSGTLYPKDRKR